MRLVRRSVAAEAWLATFNPNERLGGEHRVWVAREQRKVVRFHLSAPFSGRRSRRRLTQPNQRVEVATCTNCRRHVADCVCFGHYRDSSNMVAPLVERVSLRVGAFPAARAARVEPEGPPSPDLARDSREAVGVAHIRTRAAAALARRGLQAALRAVRVHGPITNAQRRNRAGAGGRPNLYGARGEAPVCPGRRERGGSPEPRT